MKKEYEKPSMKIEMFEANEYIAACDTKCVNGTLYEDSNKNGQYDKHYDRWLGLVNCHKPSHSDDVPQNLVDGFIVNKKNVTPVKAWFKVDKLHNIGWHAIPNHS